jgi:beta-phosphoglucomutase-like phosphatase (HAD superfamily)
VNCQSWGRMRLLIFDIDGTLIRTTALEDTAFLSALHNEFGFEGVNRNWSTYRNVTDSGILAEIFEAHEKRPPTKMETRRFQASYSGSLRSALETQPEEGLELQGAAAFIAGLRTGGEWSIALATGNWRKVALMKLARAGVRHRDLPMASADDGMAREALLRTAIERAAAIQGREFETDSVISIGDAHWDARAAAALGIRFVGVGSRWQDEDASSCAGTIIDYRDPSAILTMLDGIL